MNTISSKISINEEVSLTIHLQPQDVISDDVRDKITKVYGVAFVNSKLVLIYNSKRDIWGFPGGTIEPGEIIEDALSREMVEEANVTINEFKFLGHGWIEDDKDNLQAFFYVDGKKNGEFTGDPDEGVTKNEYIQPQDWDKHLKWKEVGEYLINTSINYNNN